ncbi:transcription elongation factor SPT6 [Stomoxys calcitrans]|uniref:Transcription elongation factor SPT6 n=1 Tax=Stomoxys calcitrans TaxID=35570 RepID=A0A1I8NPK4_STOCA|nr:transcription elongation factor SPT6 [Stomoxys calcitrans]
MADFIDSEAEESEEEEELDVRDKKRGKTNKAVADSSEEDEEDDEERIREELKDLIDDNPIEEGSDGEDSDASNASKKRKKHEDDDLDDRLEDDDYDLIEENLGVKVERRKRFKRLRRIQEEESDGEDDHVDEGLAREAIAEQLFDDDENVERQSEKSQREQPEHFEEDEEESDSDADDFIVDDEGRPIAEKKKKRRPIFTDASLQEGQDIFGVDFDYDDFSKYEEDEYEDDSEGEEYDEEGGEDDRGRVKKKSAKKVPKKTIFDLYEPSELKRGHFTDLDNEIRKTDIPERMQLRQIPVVAVPEGSSELDNEAEWIYQQAFCKPPVSQHDNMDSSRENSRKPPSAVGKIKQALEFIRNQQLEVPFISFYRKEYVKPELTTEDLWKVYYFDERWCQLLSRKNKLLILFEKMRNYQINEIMKKTDSDLAEDIRVLKDDDFERLRDVQTMEELKDVHLHFLLYYSHEIPKMQEEERKKEKELRKQQRREKRRQNLENSEEQDVVINSDDDSGDESEIQEEHLKQAKDSGPYTMCRKAGICGFAKHFGLLPEQFAENIRDSYQRHEVDQEVISPTDLAKQYLCPKFMIIDEVIHAAKFVVARQLSKEPLLRKTIREVYFERAKIIVRPTKQGIKEIDENHACYPMKYLKNKPIRELVGEQFLRLVMAEDDNLITIDIADEIEGNTSGSYIEEAKQLYQRDEFSKVVQEWNTLRGECVELALKKMVIPDLKKELKRIVLAESKEFVLKTCCKKLANWLRVAPFNPDFSDEYTFDDWGATKGIRALGLAFVPDYSQAAFCAITNPEGDVSDYLRLPHILKRKSSYRADEKSLKMADLNNLKDFIRSKKPHVVAIGGESREAQMIQADIQEIIKELVEEDQFPNIAVEIIDNELAKIYANSNKGASDFKEYPTLLKQAVSLARKIQDPLLEYSQLCGPDEEILCLRYHSLQDQLPKEELLEHLYIEFINQTNEVGVDINMAVQNSYTLNLVQFICGLGPRKGLALVKILKQTNQRLENRTQLVTLCHLGPKVFINCSGFIKIDTSSLGDSTEAYVEVLDGSRVHPETYEWARKMAIDAMEYDDEETNPAGALEEILESPERLKDLDLDAFAVELERQGFGNKSITLYDIRSELNCLYKDFRSPYRSPNSEELFDMLTKETPESFYVGKMVLVTVAGISHRKPQGEQLDQANPVRNDDTGNWQCPFCLKDDFPELSEVWNHFDAGACPGQATGIKVRLDNGLSGFIHIKNLSDKHVKNPEERVQAGQAIHVRIIKIDADRFSVDCSSKSSDLMDKNHEWRPRRDAFYDYEQEEVDNSKEKDQKQVRTKQQYVKRVIIHPSFHNKSYAEVVKIMETMDQGEVIVRPSSKGSDHLTVTWKVTKDIYQHIDVREEGKENAFSLGQSLLIGNEEFEDLDEIIARHVNPMAACARELLTYKYYRDTGGGLKDKMEEMLKEEKQKDPRKIHYFISASKNYPGKFLLSYLPKNKCRHEYVTVVPEGFRFRGQIFDSLNGFLKWFKDHYSDPIVTNTPVSTPHMNSVSRISNSGYDTPRITDSRSSHPIPQSVSVHTPHFSSTPGYHGGYVNTPYTPSGQTPFMTPYTTPHSSQTPRYGSNTPSPSSSTSHLMYGQSHNMRNSKESSGYHGNSQKYDANSYNKNNRSQRNNESLEWQIASDSWARRKRVNPAIPASRTAPTEPIRAPNYSMPPPSNDYPNPNTQYVEENRVRTLDYQRSPRSIRSTPRTNTSPHSMNLGDSTPLYDEN